jgi:hypothetical protein
MNITKSRWFFWRAFRNMVCLIPAGRRLLFPSTMLASRFGRGDAEYSWDVFLHHFAQLREVGFQSARNVLEIGPGRNLGTALLWWAYLTPAIEDETVGIVCWDVFYNAKPNATGFWAGLAQGLLQKLPEDIKDDSSVCSIRQRLHEVAEGRSIPDIDYRVETLAAFEADMSSLERTFDLADHGCRESNHVEMLEWSEWRYWITMRFIPGAINRWCACHHLEKLSALGFKILTQKRSLANCLPIPLGAISTAFRQLEEFELRTVALDVVGKRASR